LITFLQGDMFRSNAQVITNTVNCVGVMGAGLAKEFKSKYPGMYEDYSERCEKGLVRAGEPYLWEDEDVQILNFPTKRHWHQDSKIEDIEAGLKYLSENFRSMGINSIALPPLGCGLGNLKWADVRKLIEKYLTAIPDLEVYVYEPLASAKSVLIEGGTKKRSSSDTESTAALPS